MQQMDDGSTQRNDYCLKQRLQGMCMAGPESSSQVNLLSQSIPFINVQLALPQKTCKEFRIGHGKVLKAVSVSFTSEFKRRRTADKEWAFGGELL